MFPHVLRSRPHACQKIPLSENARLVRTRVIKQENDNRVPPELREIEQQLHDRRPALTALELDAVKLQVIASASRESKPLFAKKKGQFMRSRVALVLVLALGVFMSGTGATLAVTGLADTGSASSAQYPSGHHKTLGVTEKGGSNESTEPAATQAVEQEAVSGGGSTLPFTGFVAIPVLLVGFGLLGAGVAMRMRVRSENRS
jgi:hypothetical protein